MNIRHKTFIRKNANNDFGYLTVYETMIDHRFFSTNSVDTGWQWIPKASLTWALGFISASGWQDYNGGLFVTEDGKLSGEAVTKPQLQLPLITLKNGDKPDVFLSIYKCSDADKKLGLQWFSLQTDKPVRGHLSGYLNFGELVNNFIKEGWTRYDGPCYASFPTGELATRQRNSMFQASDYRHLFSRSSLKNEAIWDEIARVVLNCPKQGDRNPAGKIYHNVTKWAGTTYSQNCIQPHEIAPIEMFDAIQNRASALLDPRTRGQAQNELTTLCKRFWKESECDSKPLRETAPAEVTVQNVSGLSEGDELHPETLGGHAVCAVGYTDDIDRKSTQKVIFTPDDPKSWAKPKKDSAIFINEHGSVNMPEWHCTGLPKDFVLKLKSPKAQKLTEPKAQEQIVMTPEEQKAQQENIENAAMTFGAGVLIAICDTALIWYNKGINNVPAPAFIGGTIVNAAWVAYLSGSIWETTHQSIVARANNRNKTRNLSGNAPQATGWTIRKIVGLGLAVAALSHIGEITRVAAPVVTQTWNAVYTSFRHGMQEQDAKQVHNVEPVSLTLK